MPVGLCSVRVSMKFEVCLKKGIYAFAPVTFRVASSISACINIPALHWLMYDVTFIMLRMLLRQHKLERRVHRENDEMRCYIGDLKFF